ncbi:single-stranded DNA-binding protein, partial [Xanthomonas oryzae pv. oryzae]
YPYEARLEDGQNPFAPGEYELDVAGMLQVNKGNIALGKFAKLKPRQPSSPRAAA